MMVDQEKYTRRSIERSIGIPSGLLLCMCTSCMRRSLPPTTPLLFVILSSFTVFRTFSFAGFYLIQFFRNTGIHPVGWLMLCMVVV